MGLPARAQMQHIKNLQKSMHQCYENIGKDEFPSAAESFYALQHLLLLQLHELDGMNPYVTRPRQENPEETEALSKEEDPTSYSAMIKRAPGKAWADSEESDLDKVPPELQAPSLRRPSRVSFRTLRHEESYMELDNSCKRDLIS